jgi:hypothetical protein
MTVRVGSERRMRAATLAPVGRRPRAANFHEGLTGGLEGGSTIRRSGRGVPLGGGMVEVYLGNGQWSSPTPRDREFS